MDDFVVTKLTEWQLPGLIETFTGNLISCHLRLLHGFILHFVTSVAANVKPKT